MTLILTLKKIRKIAEPAEVAVAVLVFALFVLTFFGHGKISEVLSDRLLQK